MYSIMKVILCLIFREYPGFVIDIFYMGSERCFVGLKRPEDVDHCGESISTDRFVAWVDKSNDTMQ